MSGRRDAGSGLARYVPAAGWLGGYQRSWLRGDLAAGLTTAAVVIPQAMAYATIAILLGLRRWGPRSLPGPLLVVGLGIVLAVTTGLADRGWPWSAPSHPACPSWPRPTSPWSAS
ncbi:MAG TPA: SulP family inorganic anion transporter [Actinomycetota bacterium]